MSNQLATKATNQLAATNQFDPLKATLERPKTTNQLSPAELEMLMRFPIYRDLVEGKTSDYKTATQQFLARIKARYSAKELQDWASKVLEANSDKTRPVELRGGDVPELIAKLDPPTEPTVVVFPKSNVTLDWGGGFGHWGLVVGPPGFHPSNPLLYVVEWVPGVVAYHSTQ